MVDQSTNNETTVVKEIIGRGAFVANVDFTDVWQSTRPTTVDHTKMDYQFYDNLRNGRAAGFRLSGLFAPTITTTIVAHVFGDDTTAELKDDNLSDQKFNKDNVEYTNKLLARFMRGNLGLFITMLDDLYSLGDQYVIVNTDGSLSVPSPDTVKIIRNPLDYRDITGYQIASKFDNVTVVDTYGAKLRTLVIKKGEKETLNETYPNLLGEVPVVHLKNNARSNELYGRPIVEPLLRLLERYDSLLEKTLDGSEVIGNPIPTFEGLEDIEGTIKANRTDGDGSYTDSQGDAQDRAVLHFDRMMAIFVGKGGSFKFAGPLVGFTSDTINMLGHLFQLAMNYSRLPEYVFGGAISSSKASAETQVPPFNRFISSRRTAIEGTGEDKEVGLKASGGLLHIIDLFLKTKRLSKRKVIVAPVTIKWADLSVADEQLRFNWVKYLDSQGYLRGETVVDESHVVEDARNEYELAQKEAQDKMEQANMFNAQLDAATKPSSGTDTVNLDNTSNNNNNSGNKVNK